MKYFYYAMILINTGTIMFNLHKMSMKPTKTQYLGYGFSSALALSVIIMSIFQLYNLGAI